MSARNEPGTWAVIAGGRTGGHLYPGVAVAKALVGPGHDPATLRFVGARRGLEARTRALEGFPVTLLARTGPGPQGLGPWPDRQPGRSGASSVAGVAIASGLFSKWRPAVVISLGGYASLGLRCRGLCLAGPDRRDQRRRRPRGGQPLGRAGGGRERRRFA